MLELKQGLTLAVNRGVLLQTSLNEDDKVKEVYFLNKQESQEAAKKIVESQGLTSSVEENYIRSGTSKQDIFSLYEQNFGLLTPMTVEQLKDMEGNYPAGWIGDAFKLAVSLNKRRLSTVATILKRWEQEGKDDGEPTRHSAEETDWERYIKKVQRRKQDS
jgi:DnaD/phage-associated family protein